MTADESGADVSESFDRGAYTEAALERGRPSQPCECALGCPLHTYAGDDLCIWCRNGQHGSHGPGDDDE